jgi:hypothetical protein
MGRVCSGFAVVETCVSANQDRSIELAVETTEDYTQSSTGKGSRPSRKWVFQELGRYFPFVYQTKTQPNHPEFPTDWNNLNSAPPLIRAVFVASKEPLNLPSLRRELLDVQERLDPAAYIATLEGIMAEDRQILEERDELIRRLHTEAQDLRMQLERAVAFGNEQHRESSEFRAAAAERYAVISRLDAEVNRLRASIAEYEQRTEMLEEAASERLQSMLEKQALIMRLDAELKKSHAAAQKLRERIAALEQKVRA